MSLELWAWASRQKTGALWKKFLLLAMADGADMDGRIRAPSAWLSDYCEMSLPVQERGLSELRDSGFIVWDGDTAILPVEEREAFIHPVRKRILDRDGWVCVYCGSKDNLTLDHVIARSRGGDNSDKNLVTACRSCNSSKGAKSLEEWLER